MSPAVKSRRQRACAARPIAARPSRVSPSRIAARPAGSPSGQMRPSTPSVTLSGSPPRVAGDHGDAHHHRLEVGEARRLPARRHHQRVHPAQQVQHRGPREPAVPITGTRGGNGPVSPGPPRPRRRRAAPGRRGAPAPARRGAGRAPSAGRAARRRRAAAAPPAAGPDRRRGRGPPAARRRSATTSTRRATTRWRSARCSSERLLRIRRSVRRASAGSAARIGGAAARGGVGGEGPAVRAVDHERPRPPRAAGAAGPRRRRRSECRCTTSGRQLRSAPTTARARAASEAGPRPVRGKRMTSPSARPGSRPVASAGAITRTAPRAQSVALPRHDVVEVAADAAPGRLGHVEDAHGPSLRPRGPRRPC